MNTTVISPPTTTPLHPMFWTTFYRWIGLHAIGIVQAIRFWFE